MRKFSSGATRDSNDDKVDYLKITPAIIDHSFGQYMRRKRVQPDGSLRDFDNWQGGFGDTPEENARQCLDSIDRHVKDIALILDGYTVNERGTPISLEDSWNAIRFGSQAGLFHFIKNRKEIDR